MHRSVCVTFGRRLHGETVLVNTKAAVNRENVRERTHRIPLRCGAVGEKNEKRFKKLAELEPTST
jgi:hypothetical protein